ncbi:flagellar hook capping protein [Pirellula staleyi DSM 6068]|uniref:Basal-body rod modification protein FlgD n=1 Tax=Pirellula staleyi (strain ATCC 27377 / DSM 6068 / ICPB 4128) TaxID=530564 RepID=D2R532_PIRSD|nr:flagellar hook capping FlgD N-terminal domain-containing protein [Pirellula staleyi]ADB18994.1 flagellar hook capping protein [Pirellula staleyi DSM 6068]
MSSVAGTGSTSGAGATTNSDKPKSLEDLGIDEFLQLMITELTNQDPLNPMDNAQMVEQIGQIREIASNDKLSRTLDSVLTGQSLTTASGLIGREVTALDLNNENVEGIVDRVSIEVDEDDATKRTYKVHIGDKEIDLKNIREIKE